MGFRLGSWRPAVQFPYVVQLAEEKVHCICEFNPIDFTIADKEYQSSCASYFLDDLKSGSMNLVYVLHVVDIWFILPNGV
jgi:hypothetical protein